MFINGAFVEAKAQQTFDVTNPATQAVLGKVPEAQQADVDEAVIAAKTAFKTWSKTNVHERATVLKGIATQIRKHAKELAKLETLNNGKPIVESEMDMNDSARHFEHFAEIATKQTGQIVNTPENAHSYLTKIPLGVAGQIIPWNYPIMMAAWKLAPALAAGCTVVIKPAEQTPLSLLKLAEFFKDAGVPPGVINIVTGPGATTGNAIINHPDIDKFSFTGSSAVGQKIAIAAASNVNGPKPVTLELGGKSPNIVFEDADLETAVNGALFGIMINQGQVCSAGSRILVQRSIYDKFLDKMVEKAKNITLGSGLDRDNKMGPLISKKQLATVLNYIEIGKKEGARLLIGGTQPQDPKLAKGNYVLPTIFADVDPKSRLAQEEIFGPVAAVIPFDTEEEAVKIANDSPYGLAAAIWTQDLNRMHRMVNNVEAGIVWGNSSQPAYAEGAWGGVKKSGIGREGIEAYQDTKWVHLGLTPFFDWYPTPPAKPTEVKTDAKKVKDEPPKGGFFGDDN
ncbi:MAG: aldehyde dehydrogenase family protein [Cyanobacteria bacterium]|nr:aldehyde dehydrogenase family protein [Cyanobacteriota bacterium]